MLMHKARIIFIVCYLYWHCYISSLKLTLTSPPFSQIRNHFSEAHQNYNINKEQFKIISKAQSKFDLDIKESLLIKIVNPKLNNIDALNLKSILISNLLK